LSPASRAPRLARRRGRSLCGTFSFTPLASTTVLLNPAPNDPASRGEYGWDGTAGTIFWVSPVKETVIVLMTQSSPSNPDQIRQRFKAIVQQAIVE
jgi:CubicO group peptidase (beta-lactamase class C family)